LVGVFEQLNKNVRFCLFSAQGASPSEKSFIRFANTKGRAENTLLISNLTENTFSIRVSSCQVQILKTPPCRKNYLNQSIAYFP
jgi:hypothetical protein